MLVRHALGFSGIEMDASSEQMRRHPCGKVTFPILNLIALNLRRRRNGHFLLFDALLIIKSKIYLLLCYVSGSYCENIIPSRRRRYGHGAYRQYSKGAVCKYKRPSDYQLRYVSDLLQKR